MTNPKIILVIAYLAVSCIHADRITRIEVRTAECDDCGMSNTFGALRMQVDNKNGPIDQKLGNFILV